MPNIENPWTPPRPLPTQWLLLPCQHCGTVYLLEPLEVCGACTQTDGQPQVAMRRIPDTEERP